MYVSSLSSRAVKCGLQVNRAVPSVDLFAAGDIVQFTISGSNIGNLRISSLSLELSGNPVTPSTLACQVAGQPYTLLNITALTQATIQPGLGGSCTGTYTITTADIEAGPRELTVAVHGQSATGQVVDTSQTVMVTPEIRRVLTADVALDLCSNTTAAGELQGAD